MANNVIYIQKLTFRNKPPSHHKSTNVQTSTKRRARTGMKERVYRYAKTHVHSGTKATNVQIFEQKALLQKFFHGNLTLPKSTGKCWVERGLNSHLRDTGPPLYLLNYRVHRDWIQQVERRTGIPKVRVQIPLESTFFSWLWQCQIIMKIFLFTYLWGWFWKSPLTPRPNFETWPTIDICYQRVLVR